jgi:DNA-directed RNA polymerase specialized sigma24 family protein
MQRLRREDQQLIEQRYVHDRKPKEIAETESRSVFSIYRSLSRIHDQLLRCVARSLKEST